MPRALNQIRVSDKSSVEILMLPNDMTLQRIRTDQLMLSLACILQVLIECLCEDVVTRAIAFRAEEEIIRLSRESDSVQRAQTWAGNRGRWKARIFISVIDGVDLQIQ